MKNLPASLKCGLIQATVRVREPTTSAVRPHLYATPTAAVRLNVSSASSPVREILTAAFPSVEFDFSPPLGAEVRKAATMPPFSLTLGDAKPPGDIAPGIGDAPPPLGDSPAHSPAPLEGKMRQKRRWKRRRPHPQPPPLKERGLGATDGLGLDCFKPERECR